MVSRFHLLPTIKKEKNGLTEMHDIKAKIKEKRKKTQQQPKNPQTSSQDSA